MSKITLEPNSSGAGTFSIVSPDSNINRTLTLPDEDGTVLSNAIIGTEPDQIPTNSIVPEGYTDQDALDLFNVTGSAPVYACRAWVNFSNVGGITIFSSGNVSSISEGSGGDMDINFTTSMIDDNYCVFGSSSKESGGISAGNSAFITGRERSGGNDSTRVSDLFLLNANGDRTTSDHISVGVIR